MQREFPAHTHFVFARLPLLGQAVDTLTEAIGERRTPRLGAWELKIP